MEQLYRNEWEKDVKGRKTYLKINHVGKQDKY